MNGSPRALASAPQVSPCLYTRAPSLEPPLTLATLKESDHQLTTLLEPAQATGTFLPLESPPSSLKTPRSLMTDSANTHALSGSSHLSNPKPTPAAFFVLFFVKRRKNELYVPKNKNRWLRESEGFTGDPSWRQQSRSFLSNSPGPELPGPK